MRIFNKKSGTHSDDVAETKVYNNVTVNPNSDEFEINNWEASDFVLNKLVPVVGMHPFPFQELILMTGAVCRFKPTHIFEWGTHIGKSARVFYEITTTFNIKSKIYSIDLPDDAEHNEHPHEQRGMLVKGKPNVTLVQGDGLDDSIRILKNAKGSKIKPLFFIDGDHSYESVKREFGGLIKAYPDSVFLLHDTFYQSKNSGYNIGPYQAIVDVLANKKGYKVLSTNTGLPGMTLVYKK